MSARDDSGPAFPLLDANLAGLHLRDPGMTLRDYFAAHATEFEVKCALEDLGHNSAAYPTFSCGTSSERNAIARLAFADAMLKARSA
jgi:hypothetical protein